MDVATLTNQLVSTDSLENWKTIAAGWDKASKSTAYAQAKPLWVKRMIEQRKLLLHPDVIQSLQHSHWVPNDAHLRMIWASILATLDEPDSKAGFKRIKVKLQQKYGYDWWEDVYWRIKHAYAAHARIKKNYGDSNPGMQMLASKTILFGSMLEDEYIAALKMIPKD